MSFSVIIFFIKEYIRLSFLPINKTWINYCFVSLLYKKIAFLKYKEKRKESKKLVISFNNKEKRKSHRLLF